MGLSYRHPAMPHRHTLGRISAALLAALVALCLLTLPYSCGRVSEPESVALTPRYAAGSPVEARVPPLWVVPDAVTHARFDGMGGVPEFWLGSDLLGRSVLVRCLAGGAISLLVGFIAAGLSVTLGTLYGAIAAYAGGATDAVMMRIVDILYGLPYVLLVVLLSVAGDSVLSEYVSRHGDRAALVREAVRGEASGVQSSEEISRWLEEHPERKNTMEAAAFAAKPPRVLSEHTRMLFDLGTLVVAIGAVSWLTMARVIRGQVLSLKSRPFIDAARVVGVSRRRIFFRHLLPNLAGPIVVYATLAVPQAILQESFLSFLGIGVKPPLPSWGNLAAEGLGELNPYRSHWWLLVFPCGLLASTLLALNFVGEMVRERLDPGNNHR